MDRWWIFNILQWPKDHEGRHLRPVTVKKPREMSMMEKFTEYEWRIRGMERWRAEAMWKKQMGVRDES